MKFRRALVLASIFAACFAPRAGAAASDPAKFSHGTVSLFTDFASIQPGTDFTLGVHFMLEPHWHIYWVNSGDSGEPPKISWQLPRGVTAGAISWPVPSKLGSATVVDFGYEKDVTLLVHMHADASVPVTPSATLGANVRVLICSNMCLPQQAGTKLVIPVNSQAPAADANGAAMMREARSRLPQAAPAAWKFSTAEAKDSFTLTVRTADHFTAAQFFPLEPSQVDNAAAQAFRANAGGFQLTLHKSDDLTGPVAHLKGVLVMPGGKAYAIDAPVQKAGG